MGRSGLQRQGLPSGDGEGLSFAITLAVGVVAALDALAVAFASQLEAVRIHGRQDVDARAVDQRRDVLVATVIGRQVFD